MATDTNGELLSDVSDPPTAKDYVLAPISERSAGIIYIEARIQDNIELENLELVQDVLEKELSKRDQVYDIGQDLLADSYKASLLLRGNHGNAAEVLHSLKVVEYIGPDCETTCHSTNDVRAIVQVYKLCTTSNEKDLIPQGEVTSMPHISFDGNWDDLVFDKDLKGELIRTMTNILWFSQKSGKKRAGMNPLILLHGPPGSGKTTLAQGLAQKISIRLKDTYKDTKLIQIRTATLLSKYYSESAKQVDEIFATIESLCKNDNEQFICVLIDEVESIAGSRESSMHGEAQDSLRATNSLLTGLDRAGKFPNIIFLCTTNMLDSLDLAFIDRCGLRIAVDSPSPPIQYEILRGRLQSLITDGLITPNCRLPCYRDAQLEATLLEEELYGNRLIRIVSLINESSGAISGRSLTQLPEMSVLRHLKGTECDLDMAFRFMERSIEMAVGPKEETYKYTTLGDNVVKVDHRSQKHGRDDDIDWALATAEKLASTLREVKRFKGVS